MKFEGVRVESTHLSAYIGEKVHVLDGYGENYEISEYRPRVADMGWGRRTRAGRRILTLTSLASGTRWTRSPKGGVTLLDADVFVVDGEAREHDFGSFEPSPPDTSA